VRVLDTREDSHNIHVALEFCEDGDFAEKMQERSGSWLEAEACNWMLQVFSAISVLHARYICHRNVKPDTFLVRKGCLKLFDFGLARWLRPGDLLTERCGTPAYMAPEQYLLPTRSRGYSHAVDLWAAGVVMYILLCEGLHPFLCSQGYVDENRLLRGNPSFAREVLVRNGAGFRSDTCGFSDASRKLCHQLLNPQVARRVTADVARRHVWVKGAILFPMLDRQNTLSTLHLDGKHGRSDANVDDCTYSSTHTGHTSTNGSGASSHSRSPRIEVEQPTTGARNCLRHAEWEPITPREEAGACCSPTLQPRVPIEAFDHPLVPLDHHPLGIALSPYTKCGHPLSVALLPSNKLAWRTDYYSDSRGSNKVAWPQQL